MNELIADLRALQERSQSVRLFPPATAKLVARSMGKLPGSPDRDLVEFYGQSNGASILDYCIAGCKNPRIVDIADNTLELWSSNNLLALDFVAFVATSAGHAFGYLRKIEPGARLHPVAIVTDVDQGALLPIASSVGLFLDDLVQCVRHTLAVNAEAYYVEVPHDWPFNLHDRMRADPILTSMYRNGTFDAYWQDDSTLRSLVKDALPTKGD